MKNQLITLFGGGGFVGRYVARALLQQGARLRIAQRDPRQAYFLRTQGGLGNTQFIAVDVRKPEMVARAVVGSDAVVNLVGVLSGDMAAVHADGAAAIAQGARDAGAGALVHVSAIGADPASPSAYGRSKGEGEARVREFFPQATIVRPSVIFGREDDFVNRFARMAAGAPILPIVAAGTRFQPVYVADVAHAIATALGDPERFGGRSYDLGGPDVLTMGELMHDIARWVGRTGPTIALPDAVAGLIAALPGTPITRDQWAMLQRDNVAAPDAEGLRAFGIAPTPLEAVAPSWLVQYRRNGRFSRKAGA